VKNRTLFFALGTLGLALGSVPLAGCSYIKAYKARAAYAQYQDAASAGDLLAARIALLKLVRADGDVADYWIELGKLQIQLGDYRGAYDAFSHAHELDRSNVDVLATLAQIALMSRDINLASEQAQTLSLVAPDHPVVALVRGFVAYASGNLDKAEADADGLLSTAPNNSLARILKARILIQKNYPEQAIAELEEQHRAVPQDAGAIRALSIIYRLREDWPNLARIQSDAYRLNAKDAAAAQGMIEALLRSGNVAAAGRASLPQLSGASSPEIVGEVLDLWARFAPKGATLPDGMKLANGATGERRLSFAKYYNRVGQPGAAAALLGGSQLPVTHVNAPWNAAVAQSLALRGRDDEANKLFDLVLNREPDQVDALRGRSALEARTGRTRQAVIDAQRLVTITPKTGEDRLLLAQAHLAARNDDEVRRTLWQAFQDLPDDERVYAALKSVLASTGDKEGEQRLANELADRRTTKLTKEMI
jgi:tetratricopeptide (TPR) repeat protein